MTRPWLEAGIAQAMQQVVYTVKGVLCPELRFENALKVFATKRANAIAAAGASLDAGLECGLVITPEFRWSTGARLLGEVGQPTVAIAVGPLLHKPPTAVEIACDLKRRLSVQREQDRPIPITLFGVALLSLKLLEDIQILRATKFDVHAKPPRINSREV
jgi:hypothetical protein